MKKFSFRKLAVTALPLVLSATVAFAEAEHGGHGEGGEVDFWGTLIVGVVNSGLLFTALIILLRKPLSEYFVKRSKDIDDAINAAAKAKADAERVLAEAKQKVAGAEADIANLRKRFESEAQAERDHMLKEAEKTAARIVNDARMMAEGERDRALHDLRTEANRLATELAEKKVREKITTDDQKRLAEDFVAKLGGVK